MQTRKTFLESLAITGGILLSPKFFSLKYPIMPVKSKQGISRLELVSNLLDEQEKFYDKIMELPVTRISATKIKVQAGSTELFFYEDTAYHNPVYHYAFNVPENKLGEAIGWLKKKNITLSKNRDGNEIFDFRNWNAHSVYWQDPAGNVLEFIARHNLSNASDDKFSQAGILYASEIGLVVENVPSEIKNIYDHLDLETFKGYTTNFAAIGNEYNLLIVVEKNRPWLGGSANIPAFPFPVASHLRNGNKKTSMNFKEYPFSISTEIES